MNVETVNAVLPPERSGRYLCYTKYGEWVVLEYSKRHDTWNASDSCTSQEANGFAMHSVLVWGALEDDPDKIIKEAF